MPPANIAIPADAVAVALNTRGDAAITANEVDYYFLDVPAGATHVISAGTPASNLDTVLGLYDANGLRIAFNDDVSAANFDSTLNRFLTPGRYYFGITNLAGTPGGSYTWSVAEPAIIPDNNTLATATDLGLLTDPSTFQNLLIIGADDWNRFTMNAAGTSGDRVAVELTSGSGDLQLVLTDAAGVPLRQSLGSTSTEEVSLDGLPAGTYYVHVFGATPFSFYTLDIDPGTAPFVISLDASGAGTGADTVGLKDFTDPLPDLVRFTATVTGRVSILMRADRPFMQSLLSDPRQVSPLASPVAIANQAFVAGQFAGTQDHLMQFDALAGRTYQFSAGVPGAVGFLPPKVGAYRIFISTEPLGSDFSAVTPREVPLDASGSGLQLGTLETAGDIDLFSFTATVTGRTTVRVDGGAGLDQVVHLLTTPGQRYAVQVFDANGRPGAYALSIASIADDLPDIVVNPVALDATGAGNVKGTINYAGDADVFRFTATQTGTITVRMLSRPGIDTFAALACALSVTPTPTALYESSPSRLSTAGNPAFDRVLQFQVVQGQQYTIRASGDGGSSGAYLLSFAMAVDDNAGTPKTIALFPQGLPAQGSLTRPPVTQTGTIETPQDQDRFQFSTGEFEGFVIVALEPMAGTSMQGLLTVPSLPAVVGTQSDPGPDPSWQFVHFGSPPTTGGVLFQAFSNSGWEEDSRSAFLGFYVKKNQTYEFLVSGNQTTIGEYQLTFGTYRGFAVGSYGFGDTFVTRSLTRISGVDAISTNTRLLTFNFTNDSPPLVTVRDENIAPLPETGNSPGATNTRLAVFSLPAANPGTAMVTVPSGPAIVAPNTLIASLLIVAARDNAVRPVEDVVVAQGADAVSTFLTSLLIGVIATTTGGDAADGATVVGGTVFADQDANGRLNAGEAGVPGEKVVLEAWRDGRYVEVAAAITDDQGAYSFGTVAAGTYRVRRLVKAGTQSTTPTSFEIKVTNDGKPKTLNFGTPMPRGQTLMPAASPTYLAALLGCDDGSPENANCEKLEPVLVDDSTHVLLKDDRAATDGWAGLIWLLPAAVLGIATARRHRRLSADGGQDRG